MFVLGLYFLSGKFFVCIPARKKSYYRNQESGFRLIKQKKQFQNDNGKRKKGFTHHLHHPTMKIMELIFFCFSEMRLFRFTTL